MLKVRTTIGPSKIHGIGLFAAEDIPRGTVVWEFTPGFDRRFSEAAMERLPELARDYLRTYAYKSRATRLYILPEDHGKYFNHSDSPNTRSRQPSGSREVVTCAIRDIWAGEELTDDYSSFEDDLPPTPTLGGRHCEGP